MTAAKTFAKRFNAQRAARSELKNPKAVEGKDFVTAKNGKGEWTISVTIEQLPNTAAGKANAESWNGLPSIKGAGAKAAAAAKPAATPAPAKAKTLGQRAQAEADAAAGKMPTPPDFSAETHARFRKRLADIVGFAEAGDIKALKADTTEPKSSSRTAVCRYRDLCIVALEAQRASKAAA